MNLYESIFIARQELSSAQVDTLTEKFSGILTEKGAEVSRTEYAGLKQLAYPIKKSHKGHYVLMNVTAGGDAIEEMERNMRLSEDVIRFLTIAVDEHQTQPSALLQQPRPPRTYGGRDFSDDRPKRPFRGDRDRSSGSTSAQDSSNRDSSSQDTPNDKSPSDKS
ncbi:MAG: 30S ribosomal protein S6 [Pseudomonadota bacterium]